MRNWNGDPAAASKGISAPLMQEPGSPFGSMVWELPPVILHPLADQSGAAKLLESSRASLMLQGLLPTDDFATDDLTRKLLEGRMSEIRMLYFVGKDVLRWMAQCVDFVSRLEELASRGLKEASFAALLVGDPPQNVVAKLQAWGVSDFRAIFSRGIGLNAVFRQAPEADRLSEEFVKNYYRFADHMFACRQHLEPFTEIDTRNFHFDLFASGEYSRMLEKEWGTEGEAP